MQRGFVLQPTYRVESGRPVVWLYGILESGGSFLIRDDRLRPRFYVRRTDAERARRLGAGITESAAAGHTLDGEPVVRVELHLPADTPPLRDRLEASGIPTFEADVRFAYRYLIDHGIRGSLAIEGEPSSTAGIDVVFENPKIRPADWTPSLSVLSIDIETDPRARRLLSVALSGCGADEVLLLTRPGQDCPHGAVACADERALLRRFVLRVRELDPDVLTGWNVVDFDLAVLERLAREHGVPLSLGRGPGAMRLFRAGPTGGASRVSLPGRVVLDGIQLLRGAFVRLASYSLEGAAREILGRGKTITGTDRGEEILRSWNEDRPRFVEYNLNDARLVLSILSELRLVELAVERSRLTGMPPDRVAASIASFDFLYLSALAPRRIVAPTVRPADAPDPGGTGGHVLQPAPGLYRNVLVLDFKSLYPSVIRTFQIDPLGLLRHTPRGDDDPIVAPNGAAFRRAPGILPGLLDELFPRREAAKRDGNAVASQALKILMNSFYGVLGTRACRFASPQLANAITGFGRELLLWSQRWIENSGYRVLYGDTDSLFVASELEDPRVAHDLALELVNGLNGELGNHIRGRWRVESRLELEFERLYLRLHLPPVRHGSSGARKRYVGLIETDDGKRVVFTGMETVRRDWTDLARAVQRELYERLFNDRQVETYLRGVVTELRAGGLDKQLVYRKALRKRLDEYTASTPPHVAAARKATRKPRRVIEYVMTEDGPESADERKAALDREHYVQKQVRAVAQPVLALLDLDFDRVVGDDRQLRLF